MRHIKLDSSEAYCFDSIVGDELIEIPSGTYEERSQFVETNITCEDCAALFFDHLVPKTYYGG